jgi:hypothetical protein
MILFRFQDVDDGFKTPTLGRVVCSFKTLTTILRRRYFRFQDVNDGFKTPKCVTKMSASRSAMSEVWA